MVPMVPMPIVPMPIVPTSVVPLPVMPVATVMVVLAVVAVVAHLPAGRSVVIMGWRVGERWSVVLGEISRCIAVSAEMVMQG